MICPNCSEAANTRAAIYLIGTALDAVSEVSHPFSSVAIDSLTAAMTPLETTLLVDDCDADDEFDEREDDAPPKPLIIPQPNFTLVREAADPATTPNNTKVEATQ